MILITDEPLDPEATTALVCKRSNGAVVTFLGVTRDTTADRRVLHLVYEAYRPMADKKLAEIAREVSEEWPVEDVAIAHRVGRLEIGDVSLVVAVASPHRRDRLRGESARRGPHQADRAHLEEGVFRRRRSMGRKP